MKTIPIRVASGNRGESAPNAPIAAQRWHFGELMNAPHRLAFAAGSFMFIATALWWCAVLFARYLSLPIEWAVPMPIAHSIAMAFGFMPLFFVGFLFTAGPKWLGAPAVEARDIAWPTEIYLLAFLLFLVATHTSAPLAIAALALAAISWTVICFRFKAVIDRATVGDRVHARWVLFGVAIGALALWIIVFALATENYTLMRLAVISAIWGCLCLVYAVVAHRMIPFFTANVVSTLNIWCPMWILYFFLTVAFAELAFGAIELAFASVPMSLRIVQVMFESAFAACLLWLAVRWGLVQSLRARLLAMLHVGFLWLGVSLALFAISRLLLLVSDGALSLGLAPMHALTMGFLGATLMAMATRVTAGHSGRRLVADDFVWYLFWLQQVATLLRVAAAALPGAPTWLTPLAALLWAIATFLWAARHLYWYGLPRSDSKAGWRDSRTVG